MTPLNIPTQLTAAPTPPPSRSPAPPAAANEATKPASNSSKPEATNESPATFASTLKSQMDKKPSSTSKADASGKPGKAADTQAQAASGEENLVTSSDLTALLPLLVLNNPLPDAETQTSDLVTATRDQSVLAAPAAVGPGDELPQASLPVAVIQLTPEAAESTQNALPGQTKKDNKPEVFVPLTSAEQSANTPITEKFAVDAAIAAERHTRHTETVSSEPKADDFRAFMERATTLTQTSTGRTEASSVASLRIDTPMGQTGWHDEMGQKLTWMVGNNRQQADLVLTPPQLGRVEVSLTINGDQASAVFTSANPAVREALEESMERLRETLASAGVTLGQAQVGAETPNQFANAEEQGNNSSTGRNNGERYGSELGLPMTASISRPASGRGMVDLFA